MDSKAFIIAVYIVGMALAVAEIFLPGAIAGILAALCILGSLYLAFQLPDHTLGWVLMIVTVAFVPAFIALWLKVLSRVFAMRYTQAGYTSANKSESNLVGSEGVVLTPLRPAGTALINGRRLDVVSVGEAIDRDARVRVIEVSGNRIVVRVVKGL